MDQRPAGEVVAGQDDNLNVSKLGRSCRNGHTTRGVKGNVAFVPIVREFGLINIAQANLTAFREHGAAVEF